MSTLISKHVPIDILPGVHPTTDTTLSESKHYTYTEKIRFVDGKPQKIGGWEDENLSGSDLKGCVRSIFSNVFTSSICTMFGTTYGLYASYGSILTNITPLDSSSTTVANSIDTHYDTLSSNPVATTSGSADIVVTDTEASLFKVNDIYSLSGSTSVGGIPDTEINVDHSIISISGNEITLSVSTSASSTTTGGGASVVRTSGLITINHTSHGNSEDDRVSIDSAADTGGITAAQINLEFVIRNVDTNTFDVMTAGKATSSVSSGGGASTEYYAQIASDNCDASYGQGYGMGLYGRGLYGTALVSTTGIVYPRVWSFDRFGDVVVCTPGNGGGLYEWDGDTTEAPTLVTNAPTQVNYAFVSNNIIVCLGADGVDNKIRSCDIADKTDWTPASESQAFSDVIEGAGKFISHASVNGINILFTDTQAYTFNYIGGSAIWDIQFKDYVGCIGPKARAVANGKVYWMSNSNFYVFDGGSIQVLSSAYTSESTIKRYVFDDINILQGYKSFAWYNRKFQEIWFHYPSSGSNDIDRIARFNIYDKHWSIDLMDRTASEFPESISGYPRLIDSDNTFYKHEKGFDSDGSAMSWQLDTNLRAFATDNVLNTGVIPDSIQTGDISCTIEAYSFPSSSTAINSKTVTVSPDTEIIPIDVDGRYFKYSLTGEVLSQNFIMGSWKEQIQRSSRA